MSSFDCVTALARTSFSSREREHAFRLANLVHDWRDLLAAADRHKVGSLVWNGIQTIDATALVPESVRTEFDRLTRAVTYSNMLRAGELARVMDALSDCGIDAIPLRGPTLTSRLYGDLGLRVFGDLDILVQQDRILDAARALESIGILPKQTFEDTALSRLLRTDCEWHFVSSRETHVELHWRLFPRSMRFGAFERGLWSRSRKDVYMGRSVSVLSPADEAIMMSLHHGGKHRWCELRHVCDFSQLIRSGRLDWREVAAHARRVGALRHMLTGLVVVREVLGVPVPEEMLAVLESDSASVRNGTDLSLRLLGGDSRLIYHAPVMFCVGQRERMRDKLRYFPWLAAWAFRGIFVPTEKELRYFSPPKSVRFLLVPYRLGRLSVKYLAALLLGKPIRRYDRDRRVNHF